MFTRIWILELETVPRTDMDTEIASRAEFFVDDGDRTMCWTADKLAHLAKLIADRLNWANHPACAAINTDVWINDVQHVSITRDCVNGAIR